MHTRGSTRVERKQSLDSACRWVRQAAVQERTSLLLDLVNNSRHGPARGACKLVAGHQPLGQGRHFEEAHAVSSLLFGQRIKVCLLLVFSLDCKELPRLAVFYVADTMGFLTGYACCVTTKFCDTEMASQEVFVFKDGAAIPVTPQASI